MITQQNNNSHLVLILMVFLLQLLVTSNSLASSDKLLEKKLEPIRFQLRWHHQFQFAGYYAAVEKGFYKEAGFDVTLVAGSPELQPVNEVLSGRAQYAEGNSEVLLSRLQGEPLVAMAVIFQHSPSVLLTLASSGIKTPQDLIGKRVMTVGGDGDANFLAMLRRNHVDPSQVEIMPSSYQLSDLITGKVDAFNSYLTNEPYFMQERGINFHVINPRDYGVDFYSDILFTSEKEVKNNPERVEKIKQATIRGWRYALSNPEEIIQIISDKYNNKKTINHMRFEALSSNSLILPELIEMGYVNPERVNAMAEVFKELGMVDDLSHLDGFVFVADNELPEGLYSLIFGICLFLVALMLVAMVLALFNHRLQKEINERRAVEDKLKRLADTDSLTGLLNRRAFTERYNTELMRAKRYGDVFSIILIDLDFFKRINDVYGHDAGDTVLVKMAQLLHGNTRESDICGRFGGEEFILLLPKTTVAEARVYANRLCQKIRTQSVPLRGDEVVSVTASVGVVEWAAEDGGEMTIIKADKALYHAKKHGRDQVIVWHQGL